LFNITNKKIIMNLFDSASLVVTPNGVKEGKLYSIKPTDGSGDLSVTRATTATRVNSAGLVEVVPRNLVTYSNTFSNSDWVKSDVTFTSGQEDPFGGTNGWRYLTTNASNGYVFQDGITINGQQMTLSFWVKSNTGSNQTFRMTANSGSQSSPTLTANSTWQRVTWSFTSSNGGSNVLIAYNGTSILDLLIYGFQAESSATATDYYPTTTRLNIPRLDYTNGSCPSILVEPQRTNLVTYSNDFSNSSWVKDGVTLTPNFGVSPDGTQNSTKVTFSADTQIYKLIGTQTNPVTSIYIKGINGETIKFFNNQTNSYVTKTLNGTWQRIVDITSGSAFSYLGIGTYGGVTARVVEIWGAQFELGAYPTSYIPTTSASVTRNADVISKTGISSLIGQTEGTMFWEFTNPIATGTNDYFNLSDGSADNWILVGIDSSGFIFYINAGGVNQVYITSPLTVGTHKIAMSYKNNDVVCYVNGTQVGTDTNVTIPATSKINLSMANMADAKTIPNYTKLAAIWKTKLTNDQLATLTTI
jgi:hypothetical protein